MKKISLLTFFIVKTLVLVLAFAPLSASAYALDFFGVSLGRSIQGALVMNVRADGDMNFDAGFNSALSVQNLALAGGDVEVIERDEFTGTSADGRVRVSFHIGSEQHAESFEQTTTQIAELLSIENSLNISN